MKAATGMMSDRAFTGRLMQVVAAISVLTIVFISGYLMLLLRLPREQWLGFGQIVAAFFVVLFALTTRQALALFRPTRRYFQRLEQGAADRASLEAAFANLSALPLAQFLQGLLWWTIGGVCVAGAMYVRYESFQLFPALIMVLAATSGGFISSVFLFFIHKQGFAAMLRALAREIGDPDCRARLVRPVPLQQKLFVTITGVCFVTVSFAMCLSYVVSQRSLEQRMSAVQARLLDEQEALLGIAAGPAPNVDVPASLARSLARAKELGIAHAFVLVDAASGARLFGPESALVPEEIATALALYRRGEQRGLSTMMDSPNVFAWRSVGEGRAVAFASIPWRALTGDVTGMRVIFAGILLFALFVSGGLSRALAQDVGAATAEIQRDVERLASGDLTLDHVFESEDELGALARAFERMNAALRGTVSSVAGAADRVEGTATEMAAIAAHVAVGAREQDTSVRQANSLVEGLQGQVEGVAGSAQELNMLVEEASSSILEMGAAGEELNDTAGVLSSKVDEVSTSIEQMVRSVKQVVGSTESLSEAAVETSSSMEEMATAMRQVDVTAEETLKLSKTVVSSADSGRDKVRQTIEGMQSIRVATETAERVIRGLGDRAVEIGAILDVIDDVADETNLLALNAAIIAAQAGDQGRAFSVVADEIKELADRVLSSTKEIGGLIRAVQDESGNAVGAIEEGSRSVAQGVQLSMEAGESLEQITGSSREAGSRIQEIVQAVRAQTHAAARVVELMERVNAGVEAIRRATGDQDRGNEIVFRSSVAMREVAQQLRGTTEEQARGGARIRDSVDGVREAVESINRALQIQSESNAELVRFLETVAAGAVSNEESARRMEHATAELGEQAEALHQDVQRFRV